MSDLTSHAHHQHQLESHEPRESYNPFQGLKLPGILARCWMPNPPERQPLLFSKYPSYSSISPAPAPSPPTSLAEKYGSCTEILHYGCHSSVRIYARKPTSPSGISRQLYVIKILRPSSQAAILSHHRVEQALSSALSHPNILRTIDSLYNDHGELCLVMDYCAGGDLSTLITTSGRELSRTETDCFFRQLMQAVAFLHNQGIAHCDIKPENILLTVNGAVKLADFGSAEWLAKEDHELNSWLKSYPTQRKLRGTIPYIAPEQFQGGDEYDPRAGDVWAAGLVYTAMRCKGLLWRIASVEEDGRYYDYLQGRKEEEGYAPIEHLGERRVVNAIYAMLHPDPHRRISADHILRSEWMYGVKVCCAGQMGL